MPQQTDKAYLRFTQGSSDKIYQAEIVLKPGGYSVEFAYGRYGSTMQTGSKTPAPVSYARAKQIFDKLINEKLAKGYQPGAGSVIQFADGSKNKVQTGILPQLLTPVEEADLEELFTDPNFLMQEKHDGERRLVRRAGEDVTGINRDGKEVSLPVSINSAVYGLVADDLIIDGEQVGEMLYVFDILERGGLNLRKTPYMERLAILFGIVETTYGKNGSPNLKTVLTYTTEPGKRKGFNLVKDAKGEGLVFKRKDAPYKPGRPNSGGDQRKFKFTATCTCQVSGINGSKRSVRLGMYKNGKSVEVGNVTIPVNFNIPTLGALVEIRYLYAYPNGGSLYQPVYLGERNDVDVDQYSILKFKQDTADDDDET